MRKMCFRGNRLTKPPSCPKKGRRDDGSILGMTLFILFFFVAVTGLLLRAAYLDYRNVLAEYESLLEESNSEMEVLEK